MKNIKYLLFCLVLLAACSRSPQQASNQQTETGYSDASITVDSKVLDKDSTVRLFIEATLPSMNEAQARQKLLSDFAYMYTILSEYNNKDVLASGNFTLYEQTVRKTGPSTFTFYSDLKKLKVPQAVLQLQVSDSKTGRKYTHSTTLKFTNPKFRDEYAVFGPRGEVPLMQHYFHQDDTLQIKNLSRSRKLLTVYRYNHSFEPALSPMATSGKNVPKTLEVDTTFTMPSNTLFMLKDPGLYLFKGDTTELNGLGVMIVDKRFPRLTRPEELVKPLIYISTGNEIKELYATTAPKKTLDTYWLRLASGNEAKAKRTIRSYYRRVTQANELFTTYKEGWKTDMGMIYVVFGKPDHVTRHKDREIWTYTQNANFSEINFTFAKRPNQFVEDHYELVRYVEYEPIWYPTVEEWRTGISER